MINIDNGLYFRADSSAGIELWRSDGTTEGTLLVKDIRTGTASSVPQDLVNVNGSLFFTANDGTTGLELWKSDGTSSTMRVTDIFGGAGDSMGSESANGPFAAVVAKHGIVLFAANDGISGLELWKSDGTDSGTEMVKNIHASTNDIWLQSHLVVGDCIYFWRMME